MHAWIESINAIAAGWADAMLRACWQGGVTIAFVWLICRALRRLSARVQCWLWRLAYLKLLIALVWATPIELPLLPARATPIISTPAPATELARPPLVLRNGPAGKHTAPVKVVPPPTLPTALACVFTLWLLVACGSGVKFLVERRAADEPHERDRHSALPARAQHRIRPTGGDSVD